MESRRSYGDPCGIARALDAIGDRWALLIVRELIFGAKRFAHIRTGLAGISPNVLSQRLRELEVTGIVRRRELEPPASVPIYELTPRGQALEPVLIELGRWGSAQPVSASAELSVSAFLLALMTVFDASAAVDGTFALRVAGEPFSLTVSDGVIRIVRDNAGDADVTLEGDVATLRSVAFGRERYNDAERDGRLTVTGSRRLAARFGHMFPVSG